MLSIKNEQGQHVVSVDNKYIGMLLADPITHREEIIEVLKAYKDEMTPDLFSRDLYPMGNDVFIAGEFLTSIMEVDILDIYGRY